MSFKYLFTLGFIFFIYQVTAQELKQNIRGQIKDKATHLVLEGVNVIAIPTDPVMGDRSDKDGRFEIRQLPIGRYTLQFTYLGYNSVTVNDIVLNSTKEIILNIEMEEKVAISKDVVIKGKREKDKPVNELAMVSARMFSVEETGRYAGSLNDPARMAQNFAGVQANGDTRNDIIIRGNSPLGVQWRLEGIDIPNPNHFSGIGTSGGAISILNNNNLSNSDFLTGAFPAQYGNALAGVFDLRLRNGNDQHREYTVMFGMNGLEAGMEGPIQTKNHSSYIANYRYSTLGLFDKLGINFGAAAIPKYQDGVFKLNFPTQHAGELSVFGVGGYNSSAFYSKDYDTTGRKLNPLPKGFNTNFINYMGVVGLEHKYHFTKKTYGKLILAYSINGNKTNADSLYNQEQEKFLWLRRNYGERTLNGQYMLSTKWNARHLTQAGLYFNQTFFHIKDSVYLSSLSRYRKILDEDGSVQIIRAFVQHQYKFNEHITLVAGLHGQLFTLNQSKALEPRIGLRFQVRKNMWLNGGAGLHHQTQPWITYFYRVQRNAEDVATNRDIGFTQSLHGVLGLDWLFARNFRLKLETYYQSLSRIPIEQTPSSYSLVNEGAYYIVFNKPDLVNKGRGYNTGVELTIEKFFSKNYYFLVTGSVYKSMYKGSDGIERHTAFDGSYALNTLVGYDWKINKKSVLSVNAKATFLGGRRYTPLDEIASKSSLTAVYIDSLAFTKQHPAYFRPDIRISYRLNWRKVSQEWGLNINNFIDRDNIQSLEYDRTKNAVGYTYQIGFFPVVQYRLEF